MKIFLAKTFFRIGDIEFNYKKIKEIYDKSLEDGCDLLIFSEMAITGFPCYEEVLNHDFIEKSNNFLEEIIDYTKGKKTRILLGCPYFIDEINDENRIKKSELFNTVILINDGYIDAVSSKTNISKNNLFDEYRYFDKETILKSITYENDNFDVLIADDIMENKNIFFIKERDTDYVVCLDTEIHENIEKKKKQLIKIAKWTGKNVIYLNTLGYDLKNSHRFCGEIFVVNTVGEIEYSNKSINEEVIKLSSSLADGIIKILPIKENKKDNSDNFINLLADTYSDKTIVHEINNKKFENAKSKNIKLITFDKKFSNDNIEFIDYKKYTKDLKLTEELKRIIIENIYNGSLIIY